MRVLIVDQDSAMLEATVRALRERYTVDAVTTKGDCLDLLRQNVFEAVVAGERLEDGSGLELLGQVAKRWPATFRIFSADRERLRLLNGRLGPFDLFETLTYPIDPDHLIAALTRAGSTQQSQADASGIRRLTAAAAMPVAEPVAPRPLAPPPPASDRATSVSKPARVSRLVTNSAAQRAARARIASSRSAAPIPEMEVNARETGRRERRPVQFPPLASQASYPGRTPVRARFGTARGPVEMPASRSRDPRSPQPQYNDQLSEASAIARDAFSSKPPFDQNRASGLAVLIAASTVVLVALTGVAFRLFGGKRASAPPAIAASEVPRGADKASQSQKAPDESPRARISSSAELAVAPARPTGPPMRPATAPVRAAAAPVRLPATAVQRAAVAAATAPAASHKANAGHSEKRRSPAQPQRRSAPASDTATSSTASGAVVSPTALQPASTPGLPPETPPGMFLASRAAPSAGTASSQASGAFNSATSSADSPTPSVPDPGTAVVVAKPGPVAVAAPKPGTPQNPTSTAPKTMSSDEPPPVVREARLIRRVDAQYPAAAERGRIEGWVDLNVTISPQGTVSAVSVAHAEPANVFDKAAIAAVRHYRYDPQYVDGLPAEAHITVHLGFRVSR